MRADDDLNRPGDYDLPGGGVNDDDISLEHAARREIFEETGILIDASTLFEVPVLPEIILTSDVERHVFLGEAALDIVQLDPHEHKGYEWLTLEAAVLQFRHPYYNQVMNQLSADKSLRSRFGI